MKRLDDNQLETAVRGMSAAHMSDSKWYKFFDALAPFASRVANCSFYPIWSEMPATLSLGDDFQRDCDFWPSGIEGRTSIGGWVQYREIERFHLRFHDQASSDGFCEIIDGLGHYPIVQTNLDVVLSAYTR